VLYYWVAEAASAIGVSLQASAILPPDSGFSPLSLGLQLACTAVVIVACAVVVQRGLRSGIEMASKVIMPILCAILIILTVRALTLPGAMEGVRWYLLKFRLQDIDARVMVAALGQAIFSLSLGGTFMVAYGSYLKRDEPLGNAAIWTTAGDTITGLIAGLAIIPAVFALGMEPTAGPALIFSTLPQVFDRLPVGWIFGFLFYASLFGAGYLSDIAAVETLTVSLTDSTRIVRARAVWIVAAAVFVLSIPPSVNMAIFGTWDLTFGSGMQTLGSLLAVVTFGWCMHRSAALAELMASGERPVPMWLFYWIRFGIPAAILAVGVWWLLTSVLGVAADPT
jgi:NSS family neurotransmitter:Na+ symporter